MMMMTLYGSMWLKVTIVRCGLTDHAGGLTSMHSGMTALTEGTWHQHLESFDHIMWTPLINICVFFRVTMPRTRRASFSHARSKRHIVDENEEEEVEVEVENSNGNNDDSEDHNEQSENEEDEDENDDDDMPNQTHFFGLDMTRIKSEKYIILMHVNQFRFPRKYK